MERIEQVRPGPRPQGLYLVAVSCLGGHATGLGRSTPGDMRRVRPLPWRPWVRDISPGSSGSVPHDAGCSLRPGSGQPFRSWTSGGSNVVDADDPGGWSGRGGGRFAAYSFRFLRVGVRRCDAGEHRRHGDRGRARGASAVVGVRDHRGSSAAAAQGGCLRAGVHVGGDLRASDVPVRRGVGAELPVARVAGGGCRRDRSRHSRDRRFRGRDGVVRPGPAAVGGHHPAGPGAAGLAGGAAAGRRAGRGAAQAGRRRCPAAAERGDRVHRGAHSDPARPDQV